MIQNIRHARGFNDQGGGTPEVLELRTPAGMNDADRAALYRVAPGRTTMAAVEEDGPFTGCQNDAQLSFYMGKLSLSWALRGFVSGVAIGAIGTAVGLYFLGRARPR